MCACSIPQATQGDPSFGLASAWQQFLPLPLQDFLGFCHKETLNVLQTRTSRKAPAVEGIRLIACAVRGHPACEAWAISVRGP